LNKGKTKETDSKVSNHVIATLPIKRIINNTPIIKLMNSHIR